MMQGPPELTVVITAWREAATIGRAIEAFLQQPIPGNWEMIVVCPDPGTADVVARYAEREGRIRRLVDEGRGKPAALNLAFGVAQGTILLLSDGDVYVGPDSVRALLAPFGDAHVGAVSSRPVSLSPRDTMLGYWSHLLLEAGAHRQRLRREQAHQFLECSGYLYAVRRSLLQPIPEDALAEDGLISLRVWQQGYRTAYAPDALVYVKYPTNYHDWIQQKSRSTGGYAQSYLRGSRGMRTPVGEAWNGIWSALSYTSNVRELAWTLLLFAARIHVWIRVWWDVRIRRRPFAEMWQRVNSTK
jgi:cellulose synthase/poly-beta-1,6-N-acetylglucosamine synthase-like glycosyltransferase